MSRALSIPPSRAALEAGKARGSRAAATASRGPILERRVRKMMPRAVASRRSWTAPTARRGGTSPGTMR